MEDCDLFSCFCFPGLDWKVFTSSCLPKKFREDVTFGGTTYKVSGIPDGKIKAPWGFIAFPLPWIQQSLNSFLNSLNTIEYSIIQSHMKTFTHWSFCNLGAKRMSCHPLSLSSLLNNYTAVNLVFKRKENCQLKFTNKAVTPIPQSSSQKMLGLSLSCYFFCVTSGLIWTAHNYVVKIDRPTGPR